MAAAEVRINKNEEDALVEEATYIPIGLQGMLLRVIDKRYIMRLFDRYARRNQSYIETNRHQACRPALSAADA